MWISTGYFYFKKSQNRKSACQREARKGFDFQSSTEVLQRKNNFPSSDILHANHKKLSTSRTFHEILSTLGKFYFPRGNPWHFRRDWKFVGFPIGSNPEINSRVVIHGIWGCYMLEIFYSEYSDVANNQGIVYHAWWGMHIYPIPFLAIEFMRLVID